MTEESGLEITFTHAQSKKEQNMHKHMQNMKTIL